MKVLLVDDESDIREIVTLCLEMAGIEVQSTGTPSEAASLLRKHRPSLILLDQSLGEVRGTDLLEVLRAEPDFATIPVVFLTGHHDAESRRELLATGAVGVITKPFEPMDLAAQVAALLEGVGLAGPAETGRTDKIVDLEVLEGIISLESTRPGIVRKLFDQFREDAEERLDLMRLAAEVDRSMVERTAHSLKSSAGHLGAMRVWAVADEIEQAAGESREPLRPMIDRLLDAYDEAVEELMRELGSRSDIRWERDQTWSDE